MASLPGVDDSPHRRIWRVTAFALRVLCLALLVLMFSLKLRDFLRQPVVSETSVVSVPPPALTICPSALNSTALEEREEGWDLGLFTTEEVFRAASAPLECSILACSTADKQICTPGGRERNDHLCQSLGEGTPFGVTVEPSTSANRTGDLQALWQRRRIPPGLICHTLTLSSASGAPIVETVITFALDYTFYHITNGFYRIFFHAERSPKTWYGGSLVSTYHLIEGGSFQELEVTQTETLSVDREKLRCEPDDDYDFNQVSQCRRENTPMR